MGEDITVDRSLQDKMMDSIDHALGRPFDPTGETYRNHYSLVLDGQACPRFDNSPFWKKAAVNGRMTHYQVTEAGKEALARHLIAIKDPNRLFEVKYGGGTTKLAAESGEHALRKMWSKVSDCFPEITFGKFKRNAIIKVVGNLGVDA